MTNYIKESLLQSYRNISVRIIIMDYNFTVIDELSGIAENVSLSNDSESDIRRTANISVILDSGYTKTGVLNDRYFNAGNGFWFDKYISIDIGIKNNQNDEIIYYPQGIYLINEPSVTYDATTNLLSFNAIDLMAKFTGLRAGNLQGMQYQVPANSIITDVIKNILLEQGFYKCTLNTPETPYVPYDIKIESGGTTYELLAELRDINPNWEMFFDVDGTFIFQKIPSGQMNNNPTFEPTCVACDKDWNELLIGYQLSTSFDDVKNYVEVYGKTIEATANGIATISNSTIDVVSGDSTISGNKVDFVLFTLGDTTQNPTRLTNDIAYINFTDSASVTQQIECTPSIKYNNMAYILRVGGAHCEYCGYQQPVAVAWENNPNSPFYVGESKDPNMTTITPTDEIISISNPFPRMTRQVHSGGEYDNIYSNQLAIDRAKYELYQKCRLHDTITIECVPIYYLDSNQIISIILPNEKELSYWLIKSIDTEFSTSGTQSITAMRYYAEYPAN